MNGNNRNDIRREPGEILFRSAFAALQAGRLAEAEDGCRQVLLHDQSHAEALHLLGIMSLQKGDTRKGEVLIRQALAVREEAHFLVNLGNLLQQSGRLPEAETAFRHALALKPAFVEAHYGLGLLLQKTRRLPEAETAFRQVLALRPESAMCKAELSLLLLSQGRYAEAWPLYKFRYHADNKTSRTVLPDLPFPQWNGESLVGKSLLLMPEQGFGDTIQFIRYARLLKERGLVRLTLACHVSLKALLKTAAGVDAVITDRTAITPHDYWSFLPDLPLHLGTTVETIPAALPYLHASPGRVECWRERLPQNGIKVGLVWKGSATHKNDANRSLPGLEALAPLWSVPNVCFVSLQKRQGEEDAGLAPPDLPILRLCEEIMDFADTAAIISQLDLMICVDTSVAHLAGALGKPCWVLLPCNPDWRWFWDRIDSPWYPGVMQLFRQEKPGEWAPTVKRVREALIRIRGRESFNADRLPSRADHEAAASTPCQ